MLKITAAAALATATAAFGAAAAAPAGSTAETLYYGKTSQGLGVFIPVKGTQIPRDSRAYLSWKMIRTVPDALEFHPGVLSGMTFRGGRLSFHHVEKLPGGTIEVWFRTTLNPGRKAMTGTFRQRDVGYSPKPKDSGTIRFAAVAWASQTGWAWTGKTADGKPLAATLRYRLVPGHVIFNGKREQEPEYSLLVPAATRALTCRTSDGAATTITASLPALTARLLGSDDLANTFSKHGGLSGLTAGSATSNGVTVKADLTLKRLSWQGGGLAATGTLGYQGTFESEAGTATCARVSTGFTLRPR